jgi:hypothetical protein
MSTIRQYLVFLTGHRIAANAPVEEIGSLSKIGAAIAFASFLAALQFGIAGWFLAMDLHIGLQVALAITFALIGAAIVLVLDRNFIFLADTRYETDKKLTYVYLGIRIFLITVIGSLSSQFTMPLFLKSELAIHAQDMKDGRYSDAKARYQEKFELSDKTTAVSKLEQRSAQLQKELQVLTPEILRQRNASNQCFQEYRRKTSTTFAPDLDEGEILQLYAKDKRECERLEGVYRQSYRSYTAPREAELASIGEAIPQAMGAVEGAKKDIAANLAKTSQIDEAYINVASADVLSSLITHSPGVFFKYALITLLQLCLELMPILLKLQAGQSALGHRAALAAHQNKTRVLSEINRSVSRRLDSEGELQLAQHKQALVIKGQQAELQELDLSMTKQKIVHDIANQKLRQELDELKRQSSMYGRLQNQASYTYTQVADQFMNKVVTPTVAVANSALNGSFAKPSIANTSQTESNSARVFNFDPNSQTQLKAAS